MKRKIAAFWTTAFLAIAAIDYGAVILAISYWHDLTRSWEGNVNDYLIIFFGGSFYSLAVLAIDLLIFLETKVLITKEMEKCNTCGKPLLLPGADHLMCALRHHPFRALLGWVLVICWQALDLVGCPAAKWFRMREALLRRQIRKEAFRKGLRPGGKRS